MGRARAQIIGDRTGVLDATWGRFHPSGLRRAHVIYAIYDGDFKAGTVEITAHLRAGRTYTERLQLGF